MCKYNCRIDIPGYGSKHQVAIQLDTQTLGPLFEVDDGENYFMLAATNKDAPFDVQKNAVKGKKRTWAIWVDPRQLKNIMGIAR